MNKTSFLRRGFTGLLIAAFVCLFTLLWFRSGSGEPAPTSKSGSAAVANLADASVELSPSQLNAIRIEPLASSEFPQETEALGTIDYDEDRSVQVFSPYAGKIIAPMVNLGDEVQAGQPLYSIDSPDLIQAESTLIAAVATFSLTSKELVRVQELHGPNGISERELEQATSDHQTAEGAVKAAKDALRLFGKTEREIEHIAGTRQLDPALIIRSPVAGRITSRNAQPGLLVQPGLAPAPYAVADLSSKWMVANVIESDSPRLRVGQDIRASVMAYPGRVFAGKVSRLGAAVDPATHRVMVRCELADPKDELRPGMLATFLIQLEPPQASIAIPATGVVRNGDGTLSAWVTSDRRRFVQRIIKVGLESGGKRQVLEGLKLGELAVTDGAIFLSNLLQAPPGD